MLIYGDRVRSARLLRGITASVIAEKLGWSAATQTRVETANSQDVSSSQANELSRWLSVPLAYLQVVPPPVISVSELLFRTSARTTKREKDYLAEYARLVGEVLDWLDDRHRLPPVKIPTFPVSVRPADAAKKTRARLDLDHEQPIPHLVHRVERSGVTVVVRDASESVGALFSVDEGAGQSMVRSAMREDHHAYSTRVGELRDRPLVVARSHNSWERTRLTIAHELGHLVLHGRELPLDAEEQAYDFAAELLAPAAALKPLLPQQVTLAALVPIKLHFGISLGALIKHLIRSGLITDKRFESLESQLYRRRHAETGTTWGKQEPGWDSQIPERPKLMSAWLERCAGTSEPGAIVAGALPHMPIDLVASMLSGQRRTSRPAGGRAQPTASIDNESVVIDLAARRAR